MLLALHGLSDDYSHVRDQIFGSLIVPNFTSTCSILLRVPIKKINYIPATTDNSSALVFQQGEHNPSRK